MILTGGMRTPEAVREAYDQTGAAAVMLARGALGNPWLFEQVLGLRELDPTAGEVLAELDWVIDSAVDHLGPDRAARYLRKFYPWYLARLGATPATADRLARSATIDEARELLRGVGLPVTWPADVAAAAA